MYGIYLIAALVLAGGAIAFIGDRLGTKIGKKRLSIFGLRPRHTSIIITIFTGICITLLTFAIMAAASENVRTALFGMEQLNARMERTGKELSKAIEELAVAKEEQVSTNDALGKSRKEIEGLKQEQEELRQESERLKTGNRELEQANASLLAQNAGLANMNEELLGSNAALSTANAQLEDSNKSLEERAQALREGLITVREGDITFRAGEVIASGVVSATKSQEEIEADMEGIADRAMQKVFERMGDTPNEAGLWIYQPEYEAAVKTIAESNQDMIVRIVAAGNLVKGEPVRTSIELYPNSTIYGKDEFIVARAYEVHGETDAEQIVMSFLKDVNAAATAKGILPDPLSGAVGVIEGEQFYEVVQAIAPMRGVIALSAYARNETDAMGPLRLNLKLEEIRDRNE